MLVSSILKDRYETPVLYEEYENAQGIPYYAIDFMWSLFLLFVSVLGVSLSSAAEYKEDAAIWVSLIFILSLYFAQSFWKNYKGYLKIQKLSDLYLSIAYQIDVLMIMKLVVLSLVLVGGSLLFIFVSSF